MSVFFEKRNYPPGKQELGKLIPIARLLSFADSHFLESLSGFGIGTFSSGTTATRITIFFDAFFLAFFFGMGRMMPHPGTLKRDCGN
jgi:hypothetical protein